MKQLTIAAVAAVSLGLFCLNEARATTISLGPFTTQPGSNSTFFGIKSAQGMFSDDFTFDIAGPATLTASVTNAVTSSEFEINNLTLSLFSGSPSPSLSPSPGAVPLASVGAPAVATGQSQTATLTASFLSGLYYLELSGTTSGTPSPGGSISFALSPVPLPAAFPLFGGALLGLAFLGVAGRRRAVSAV